ncbi:MAG: pantetheine-phosphate adenylyltransferase [Anaerolineae bacterium]
MTKAVYPGTFDPIHLGHIDIVRRAAELFDELIVAVYACPAKHTLFDVDERLQMARQALQGLPNVTVESYHTLTVRFVLDRGAQVIVRGLRVISDFEMEYQMALTNRRLAPQVDSLCLMTSGEYAFVSSSLVKEVAQAGGSVAQFVTRPVEEALLARIGNLDCQDRG